MAKQSAKQKTNSTTKINCTKCFKSLGIESRMSIFAYLEDCGNCTVNGIVEHIGLTQPTISYHLKEMKTAGLLKATKKGKEVYYSINTQCPHHYKGCVLGKISYIKELNA